MLTPPSDDPLVQPLEHAPATLQRLRPVLRGLAAEDISSFNREALDDGRTAFGTVGTLSPVENTPGNTCENTRGTLATAAPAGVRAPLLADSIGPPRARDAALLLLIVRLRLASIQQLWRAALPDVSIVIARRRLRALTRDGWLNVWDRPVMSGGAPRYVYPTTKALRWAYARLAADASGTPAERLVQLMIPQSAKRLAHLESGTVPQWFAHQDEINQLLIARLRALGDAVLWSSSWDCPFPDQLNGLKAPQPDFVVVTMHGRVAHLTFGEHDRATEPLERWMAKLAAYAAAREVSSALFGHAEFIVEVTVADPHRRLPHVRVRELVEAIRTSGCQRFIRVTLAGWAHAFPTGRIWFAGGDLPLHDSLRPVDHVNVVA
jgi:hypothetical protein